MRFKERIQRLWHDMYYKLFPGRGVDFAMTCKEVTAKIDLGEVPPDFLGRLRFRLHISLCTACRFYLNASAALKIAIRKFVFMGEKSLDLELLNQKLLKKFTR